MQAGNSCQRVGIASLLEVAEQRGLLPCPTGLSELQSIAAAAKPIAPSAALAFQVQLATDSNPVAEVSYDELIEQQTAKTAIRNKSTEAALHHPSHSHSKQRRRNKSSKITQMAQRTVLIKQDASLSSVLGMNTAPKIRLSASDEALEVAIDEEHVRRQQIMTMLARIYRSDELATIHSLVVNYNQAKPAFMQALKEKEMQWMEVDPTRDSRPFKCILCKRHARDLGDDKTLPEGYDFGFNFRFETEDAFLSHLCSTEHKISQRFWQLRQCESSQPCEEAFGAVEASDVGTFDDLYDPHGGCEIKFTEHRCHSTCP